jgi:hypothetical protein
VSKKDTFYFSHDYGARNDPKLQKVLMRLGHKGKGIFWDLIEVMYEQGGYLVLSEIESYAFNLRIEDPNILLKLINDFDLFKIDGDKFYSESVLRRLSIRDEKSNKARKSAEARWKPKSDNNANASGNNAFASESGAIKEKKINKKKRENNSVDAPPSQNDIFILFKENSNWDEAKCNLVTKKFIIEYENNWARLNGNIIAKVKSWILTEKEKSSAKKENKFADTPDKLSDGKQIPDIPDNNFYKKIQAYEDKQKASAKWQKAGYYHKTDGKDSEHGWFLLKSLNPQSNVI